VSRKERDQVLGHAAENDGIEEYDNPLPDWWLGLFLFTIVWGVGYAIDYHFIHHRSQAKAYAAEVAWAEKKWPKPEVATEAQLTPEDIAAGKEIFMINCIGCHGTDLHGGIGPNLTDAEWIHGGTYKDVVHTITNGVPPKGMPTWGPILGQVKISKVAAFVLSKNTGEKGGIEGAAGQATPAATPAAAPAPDDATGDGAPKAP